MPDWINLRDWHGAGLRTSGTGVTVAPEQVFLALALDPGPQLREERHDERHRLIVRERSQATSPRAGMRYRFGPFRLDPARHTLEASGRERPLKPKAFALLCYLVEHRDRSVSREELFDHVWPNVIVSDNALSRAIADVRKALGDTSESPNYIRTLPRVGYRFIGAVAPETAPRPPDATPPETDGAAVDAVPSARRRRLALWGSAAALLLAAVVAGVWRLPEPEQPAPTAAKSRKLLIDFSGSASAASPAPDGERFVFVGEPDPDDQAGRALYVGSVSDARVERLPGTEGAFNPRWSPSAERILFEKRDGVWELGEGGTHRLLLPRAANARWSGDGRTLVFERDFEVWIADSRGGRQRKLIGPLATDLLVFGRTPSLSPDGSRVAYVQPQTADDHELWVQDVRGGAPRRIARAPAGSVNPVWSADATELFFERGVAGGEQRDLYRVPLHGGAVRRC